MEVSWRILMFSQRIIWMGFVLICEKLSLIVCLKLPSDSEIHSVVHLAKVELEHEKYWKRRTLINWKNGHFQMRYSKKCTGRKYTILLMVTTIFLQQMRHHIDIKLKLGIYPQKTWQCTFFAIIIFIIIISSVNICSMKSRK